MSSDSTFRLPDQNLRKPRRSAVLRVIVWLVALGFFTALAIGLFGIWAYATFTAPGPLREPRIVNVPKGADTMTIANLLEDQGVVGDSVVMGLASIAQNIRGATIKPGEYEFPPSATMAGVFNIMASGRVVTYKLTVPEGWTSEMAVNRIREHEAMAGDITATPAEGAVVANTYLFARGMTRQALIEEMVKAQTALVDDVWARRLPDSIIKSKEELLTLASIVEKETGKPEERPRVAAVFINRLKAGMRLQSDPTTIYGLAGGAGKLDRPLTQADLDSNTPYNTYVINGLPPGPIASPGRASLEAVINPAPVADLYFVADGSGGHVFAATLEQHNENVKKWRAIQAGAAPAQPESDPAATAAAPAEPAQAALPNIAEQAEPPAATTEPEAAEGTAAKKAAAEPEAAEGAAAKKAAAEPEAAEGAAAETGASAPKPGSIVKVGDDLVPIPQLKKPKP